MFKHYLIMQKWIPTGEINPVKVCHSKRVAKRIIQELKCGNLAKYFIKEI